MIRLFIRLSVILLVVNELVTPCSAFGNYRNTNNRGGNKQNRGYEDPVKTKTLSGSSTGVPSQTKHRRGLGISAWGIVILIVAIIMAFMGLYYFSICYPSICRKNTKYDLMRAPTLA